MDSSIRYMCGLLVIALFLKPFMHALQSETRSSAVAMFWLIFCGYHAFVLIGIIIEDNYYYYSIFGGSSLLTFDTIFVSLAYLLGYMVFFNLDLPKFVPIDMGNRIPIAVCVLLVMCIPVFYLQHKYYTNVVFEGGYYALSFGSSFGPIQNFISKYLPFILIFIFFATNTSKRLHLLFILPLLISHLPLVLSGQRTVMVLLLALWVVVLIDVFIKQRRQRFIVFIMFAMAALLLGFAGLIFRGGSIDAILILEILTGFSKPLIQLFSTVQLSHVDQTLGAGFLEIFPNYSYFCDLASLWSRQNTCLPFDRLYYPGNLYDTLSFVDDPIMYLNGGTSGTGIVAYLSGVSFIGLPGIASRIFAFLIVVWGISIIIKFITHCLATSYRNTFAVLICKFMLLYFYWALFFSISGTTSSLVIGSRTLVYSVIIFVSLFLLLKLVRIRNNSV